MAFIGKKNLADSVEKEEKPGRARLLLVDDDLKFCRLISDYLGLHGFDVTAVHEGNAAVQTATSPRPWDAVILDVMLPGVNGYEVLRKLRDCSQVPVLMLTALGRDETERIVGLEIGADDYLPKTSSPRELLARLRAVLRRSRQTTDQRNPGCRNQLVVGLLAIDLSTRTATVNGELLILTPVEFDLLVVLAQSGGRIKTRAQLLNEIRDRNYDIFDRSIDVHISALRKKLGDDPKNPRFIRTVRSAGYMFLHRAEDQ